MTLDRNTYGYRPTRYTPHTHTYSLYPMCSHVSGRGGLHFVKNKVSCQAELLLFIEASVVDIEFHCSSAVRHSSSYSPQALMFRFQFQIIIRTAPSQGKPQHTEPETLGKCVA